MQDPKLIVVQSYGSRIEAELAKGALEDAGIQSMIQADTAGGMRWPGPAQALKSWSAKKTQPWLGMCLPRSKATKAQTRTKPTSILQSRGAGSPRLPLQPRAVQRQKSWCCLAFVNVISLDLN